MKPQVLYIAGTGRSGSTVLAATLGRLHDFVSAGELRYLWDRGLRQNQLCECREPFRQCPFWTDVMTDAFGGFDAADRLDVVAWSRALDRQRFVPPLAAPVLRTRRFQRALDEFGVALSQLYRSILSVSGARTLIDSSKDPSYAYMLNAMRSFDLSFVHLIRDSRAVAFSSTRVRVRPEIHWTVEYMKQFTPLRSAVFWNIKHTLFELLGRNQPRYLRLRYEDFVRAPEKSAARLAELVGSGAPVAAPKVHPGAGAHSISGNPVRFDGRNLPIQLDDEWRTRLDRKDRLLVTTLTAPLLKHYGYFGDRTTSARSSRV